MSELEFLNDEWTMDLSTTEEERNLRWEMFKPFIESGEPKYFVDYKRVNKPYVAMFTWEDVKHISLNSDTFCSGKGYTINDLFDGIPFNGSLLGLDGDKHKSARGIITSAFSRSTLPKLEPMIRSVIKKCFEDFLKNNSDRSGDIYNDLSLNIPLEINRVMMGIPEEDKFYVTELTKFVVGNDDPKYGNSDPMVWMRACRQLKRYALKLARDKKGKQEDDITSLLLTETGEGKTISFDEYAQFFILMAVAGMETTSHTLAHGIKLLETNPDQKQLMLSDLDKYVPSTSEEILRMEPPAIHFRRTTTKSVHYRDIDFPEDQKIVMWYNCANRDPRKFDNPFEFIIDRPSRPSHHSFGAPGVHHCLGAQIARVEMRVFYELLYEYLPNIKFDLNDILYSRSRWSNGFIRFPVRW